MNAVPQIQIIEKERYFTQQVVSLPDQLPCPPLAPRCIRLQTRVLGLSASNLNVAKVAFLFNWWDAYPLPASLAEQIQDLDKYGRTGTWGYAKVLESTVPFVIKESYVYGYVPIGTLAFDVEVEQGQIADHIIVTSHNRAHMPFYNRYISAPAILGDQIDSKSEYIAYDALIRIMFETAHLLGRFVFSVNPHDMIPPGPDVGSPQWSIEAADLNNATVIHLAPGSKVALCLAHVFKKDARQTNPKRIIGAASKSSRAFVALTGAYDEVVATTDSIVHVLSKFQEDADHKVVLIDFGGRGEVGAKWAAELEPMFRNLLLLSVGAGVSQVKSDAVMAILRSEQKKYQVRVSLSHMRDRALRKLGEKKYFDDLEQEWNLFKKAGIRGFQTNWGTGMMDVQRGWEKLAKGEVLPQEGLVFLL